MCVCAYEIISMIDKKNDRLWLCDLSQLAPDWSLVMGCMRKESLSFQDLEVCVCVCMHVNTSLIGKKMISYARLCDISQLLLIGC